MRLLLDTHVLLWALATPERLAPAIRDQLEDPANIVLFSAASIWEIAIKARLGRADFPPSPTRVSEAARASGFLELPVHAAAAARVAALPLLHRDPFDRLLVAQAISEPALLYTADRQLPPYSELVTLIA
jgi:PIN domain nuclease of toxin-antitoxin system